MSSEHAAGEAWTGGKNPWAITWVVTIATFMETLDTSVANVSLPQIAGSLSATQDQSTWILTTYLLANAVVLPISGWLAAKIGRKRYYMWSVALFTLSSLMCGLAPSLNWLIFSRLLQGLAGGGLAPCEQSILADTFPENKRGMAMAAYGMAIIFAPAIGPTVGGYITSHFNWRWIFLINIPVGVVSLLLTQRLVSDPPHLRALQKKVVSVDYLGLVLVALGLGCMQLVLSRGQEEDWLHSSAIRWSIGISALSLISFVFWELRHPNPVVDLRIFRNRNFAIGNLMMMFGSGVLFGSTVLLPQFAQGVLHYSSQQAGYLLSPGALTIVVLMPFVGLAVTRIDPRILVVVGFTLMSAAIFYMTAHIYAGVDMPTLIRLRCFQTVGIALLFVPVNTLVYDGVTLERRSAVASLMNLSRNVGGEIGIAVVVTVLARHAQTHQARLVEHVTADNPQLPGLVATLAAELERGGIAALEATSRAYALIYKEVVTQAVVLSYSDALEVLAFGSLCMLPVGLFLKRPTSTTASLDH